MHTFLFYKTLTNVHTHGRGKPSPSSSLEVPPNSFERLSFTYELNYFCSPRDYSSLQVGAICSPFPETLWRQFYLSSPKSDRFFFPPQPNFNPLDKQRSSVLWKRANFLLTLRA